MSEDLAERAKAFAIAMHGDQKYGEKPYVAHLAAVVEVLERFKAEQGLCQEAIAAAWLHDTVEDTPATAQKVQELFGTRVAELVEAVTNGPGKNRKEKHSATYPKIRATHGATRLKLADRIANVEECLRTNSPKLKMYQKEFRDFELALHQLDLNEDMWGHLHFLLGHPK